MREGREYHERGPTSILRPDQSLDSAGVAEKHHFLTRVLGEPKIMLIGTSDDLERMGKPAPE